MKKQGYGYGLLMDAKQQKRLWEEAYSEKPAAIDLGVASTTTRRPRESAGAPD